MNTRKQSSSKRPTSGKGRSKSPKTGRPAKDVETKPITPLGNDPEWYIYDEKMFEGVISMPTIEFKGRPIPMLKSEADTGLVITDEQLRVPDVIVYRMNPSAGVNAEGPYSVSSPLNIAARKMYAEWSASNAKTSQYAPEDIAMCILSIGQIIAMINHVKRLYGIVNYFSFYNRSIPESICIAMGINYEIVRSNLSNMRNKINQLIARLDTIQFPDSINYFKKCEYIYSNVFVDREDRMPTYHLMAPSSTWQINEEILPEGTVLETVDLSRVTTYTELVDIIESMLDKVLYSATFNYIYADILNLVNRGVMHASNIHVELLPIDYVVTPLYSDQFNWQVRNMTIMGNPLEPIAPGLATTPKNDVICNTAASSIYYNPRFAELDPTHAVPLRSQQLNIPIRITDTDISPKDLLELTVYYNVKMLTEQGNKVHVTASSLSDYYCTDMIISSGGNTQHSELGSLSTNFINVPDVWGNKMVMTILQTSHIPFLAFLRANGSNVQFMPTVRLGTFTQIPAQTMKNLRYQNYLGLFSLRR